MFADEELHRHALENLDQADALLFCRVTYEMMEAAWRPPTRAGARPDWMEPFARAIDAAKKYVVSSTLEESLWYGRRSEFKYCKAYLSEFWCFAHAER
jgi:hypothetical protein